MRITIGRGKSRTVYDLPSGSIVEKAPPAEQRDYLDRIQSIVGIRREGHPDAVQ